MSCEVGWPQAIGWCWRVRRRSPTAYRCSRCPPGRQARVWRQVPRRKVADVFSQVFIRRPVLATVCSLLIMLGGAVAVPTLPIARFPELTPPSVTVLALYTGANAQAVESAVTTPLEQVINGVEGMTYMTSSSTNTGFSTVTVFFEVGRDPDLAAVDVQNRVNQAQGRMPTVVRNNGITVTKNTAGFLGGIGFYSDDDRYDSLFMSNYVDLLVRDAIKRIPGVGNVIIFGERKYAMRLWLDPGQSCRPRADGRRCCERAARAERPGGGWQHRSAAGGEGPELSAECPRGGSPDRGGTVRAGRREGRSRRHARSGARRRTGRARSRELRRQHPIWGARVGRIGGSSCCLRPMRSMSSTRSWQRWPGSSRTFHRVCIGRWPSSR